MDIELKEFVPSQEALQRLQAAMVDGMEVTSFRYLPDNAQNAMSSVNAASYILSYKHPEKFPYTITELQAAKKAFFDDAGTIPIIKKTKKGEKEINIRPQIYQMEARPEHKIFLQIATGSAANLKPDAVLRAYAESRGETLGEFALMVTRLEVYADKGTEEAHQFVTLDSFGENIE